MLCGPYLIGSESLLVRPYSLGVYVLSHDGSSADYVGRSDFDLQSRIRRSATEGGHVFFWFEYASTSTEAYAYECQLFHRLSPPCNTIHLATPPGVWTVCPAWGCSR